MPKLFLTSAILTLIAGTPVSSLAQSATQVSNQEAQTVTTATQGTGGSITNQNNRQVLLVGNPGSSPPAQPSIYIQVGQSVSSHNLLNSASSPSFPPRANAPEGGMSESFLIQQMAIESKERIAERQIESQAQLTLFNRLTPTW